MRKTRLELKVGLFVLLGLVLLAGLAFDFSKALGPCDRITAHARPSAA
jgi:hypothetical protein